MQYYLTTLNRSRLRDTDSEAKAVSYYAMSLVGHGIIALGSALYQTLFYESFRSGSWWWYWMHLSELEPASFRKRCQK
ncbi:hypothetical protein PC128_g14326 [Phytophthora cactorum]|nr:hypothetical protein PC128_g14326 [Phytophthora cactorum]